MIPLTSAIPEHFRGGYDDALYKSTFTTTTTTHRHCKQTVDIKPQSVNIYEVTE